MVFRDKYGLSFEMIGRLILINFATQIIVDYIAIKIADQVGHRKMLVLSQICSALGLSLLGICPLLTNKPYIGLIIAVIIYATGGGLTEVLVSPIVDRLPLGNKQAAMSLLHSFYCWGQVIVVVGTTFTLNIIGHEIWYIIPFIWAAVPITTVFFMAKIPLPPPIAENEKTPLTKLFQSKLFIIMLLLMLSAGASELSMSQWSSLFAEKGLGVSKVMGDLLGPCLFAVLMGLGRVGYSVFGKKTDVRKYLIFCAALCIGCYLCAALIQIPIVSLIGCALCGFSISMMWPGVLVLCSQRFPNGGTAAFGACALAGDLGCSLGPWITGLIADLAEKNNNITNLGAQLGLAPEQAGLKTGLLTAVIFPLILMFGLFFLKKMSPNSDKN